MVEITLRWSNSWFLWIQKAKKLSTEEPLEDDEDLFDMPALEGNEKVKQGKGLKILTPTNY